MTIFLKSLGHQVWGLVVGGYMKPYTCPSGWRESEVEAYEANHEALSALHHTLSPDDLCRIGKLETAKEAWEVLEKTYRSVSSSSRDESSLSEQNSSPGSKVLVVFGTLKDSLLESKSNIEENELKEKVDSLELKVHNIDENQSSCLVDELLKITSNLSNENEKLKKKLRELELGSLPIT